MTASQPSPSNRAAACRAAVVPMSPRLPSTTKTISAGTLDRSLSSAASPADPNASKKAMFGLTADAWGMAASRSISQKRSTPARLRLKPWWPVEQKRQPTAHPACDDTHKVPRSVSGMNTVSTALPAPTSRQPANPVVRSRCQSELSGPSSTTNTSARPSGDQLGLWALPWSSQAQVTSSRSTS